MNFLSLITFFPVIGSIFILLVPKNKALLIKVISLFCAAVPFIFTTFLLYLFNPSIPGVLHVSGMQFVERYPWIPTFNIEYFLGVDGLNLPLVFLTTLLFFIGVVVSWNITRAVKGYFILLLFLETGIIGTLVSLNFFLFFFFWEAVLLPIYFMIGYWGREQREYAAIKFFLYALFGSAVMLVGMLVLYFAVTPHSFDLFALIEKNNYALNFQKWVFAALFIAFAVRMSLFPLHSWLSDALVNAPSAVGMIISGIFMNLGAYGLLRICLPVLPAAGKYFSYAIALLGIINITYSVFVALAQRDLKRLAAYTGMCQMGCILLGFSVFTPAGLHGAVMHMFNYGIISALLIVSIEMLFDRMQSRDIDRMGGALSLKVPFITLAIGAAFYGVLSLPGLGTFISQVIMNVGTFQTYSIFTIIAIAMLIVLAAYFLWVLQKLFFGATQNEQPEVRDITARELATVLPLFLIAVVFGMFPMLFIRVINASATTLLSIIH